MSDNLGIQKPDGNICAEVDESIVRRLILDYFGLEAESLKQLEGYDDKNFFFRAKEEEGEGEEEEREEGTTTTTTTTPDLWAKCVKDDPSFRPENGLVFKVMNSRDSKNVEVVEGMHAAMMHLKKNDDAFKIQSWIPSKTGSCYEKVELRRSDGSTSEHILRILTFIPGKLLKSISCSKEIFYDAGFKLGKVDAALSSFRHPAFDAYHMIWHTESLPRVRDFLEAVPQDANVNGLNCRSLIVDVIDHFQEVVTPLYPLMTKGQIHGDFNEGNLIVRWENGSYVLDGLLDFGDTSYSFVAFDIAIAIAYMMLQEQSGDPIADADVGGYVLRGYMKTISLNEHDWNAIIPGIGARLAVSLVMGAYSNQMDPSNTYVLFTQRKGWDVLSRFWQVDSSVIRNRWKEMLETSE